MKLDYKSQIINEVFSAITHGIGVALSIVALVLLIMKGLNQGPLYFAAYLVYGLSLLGLYLFSTFFHTFYFTKARRLFQIFDHCGIYLLIAGTYTPYCLLGIQGQAGLALLVVVWVLAVLGICYHILAKNRKQYIETIIYIGMGWLCLLGAKSLILALGSTGITLLVLGGILFTLGAGVYSIHGVKYAHVYWHLLVVFASASMFFSIYFYL
ncbi:PAQR family membrane homeostasis protein TrhA [Ligilactobacillus equi]